MAEPAGKGWGPGIQARGLLFPALPPCAALLRLEGRRKLPATQAEKGREKSNQPPANLKGGGGGGFARFLENSLQLANLS